MPYRADIFYYWSYEAGVSVYKDFSIGQAFFKSLRENSRLFPFQTISSMCAFDFRLSLRMTPRIFFFFYMHYFCTISVDWCEIWKLPLCTLLLCFMTHYNITMGNDITRDAHCNITMGNDVARDIYCDTTMSNDIVMRTSQCIIMNLFCYILLHLLKILLFHHILLYNCTHKSLKSILNQ